jgi:hypothetical protein
MSILTSEHALKMDSSKLPASSYIVHTSVKCLNAAAAAGATVSYPADSEHRLLQQNWSTREID